MLKYILKSDVENIVDTYINIPLSQMFYPNASQYDSIENNFNVNDMSVINQYIDYEKVKIYPVFTGDTNTIVNSIAFNLHFYIGNDWTVDSTEISTIGFDEDDIKNKRQELTKTFLRLSFYDSDDLKTQNLLFYSIIFVDSDAFFFNYISNNSDISGIKMEFAVNNPITNTEIKPFEGFYIYLFGSDIQKNEKKPIYMKIEYNNAINGKTSLFLIDRSEDNKGFTLDQIKTNMFIPIKVEHDNVLNKYVYWFDNYNNQNIEINLYQAKVI